MTIDDTTMLTDEFHSMTLRLIAEFTGSRRARSSPSSSCAGASSRLPESTAPV